MANNICQWWLQSVKYVTVRQFCTRSQSVNYQSSISQHSVRNQSKINHQSMNNHSTFSQQSINIQSPISHQSVKQLRLLFQVLYTGFIYENRGRKHYRYHYVRCWLYITSYNPKSAKFNKSIQVFLNFQFQVCLAYVVLK